MGQQAGDDLDCIAHVLAAAKVAGQGPDFDTPNSGANCRSVSGRLHGRPLRTGSAPSRRSAVISLPNCRGLSPVNRAIQDGSGAVITPDTARSSHS